MGTIARSAWMEAWETDVSGSDASRRSEARAAARVTGRARSARYYGREATARMPRPARELERPQPLPKPKLVTRRRPQWPLIAMVMAFAAIVLSVSIICPMLLSSSAMDTESQVGRLENTQGKLASSIAALDSQVSALSAPDRVAEQATTLGLEPAEGVQYLQADTGETEGDLTVAGR
jgi:cell division protein FtsL